ncbi:spermatogenesis-associated protein 20 isoform X4 [Rhinatrema bivittatum]|uniref:spermatogenesis-associated protein 20 isoform X4 n=1 Tax=Rhinatrema bivittatum TaxID=194408 RepID=UPI001126C76A|nr:spermatogenesis-associated protein 20 isoform X4 [Rhinatrema bivittatum]
MLAGPIRCFRGAPALLCWAGLTRAGCSRRTLHKGESVTMASKGQGSKSSLHRKTNRLIHEKSPYLLQHAHNPVDWFPWGQEAFDKAQKENKPIFLSVGYSTCHWCHVMEQESFENEEIGRILDENFVCIKVDREERPDIDKVYMTFVQATSSGGGWPMSVWLTPDRQPFVGGTYFPREDTMYKVGFRTILLRIAEQWRQNRDSLLDSSERILTALKSTSRIYARASEMPPACHEVVAKCFQQLEGLFDEEHGGFSEGPKFPTPVKLRFLFSFWAFKRTTPEGSQALHMAMHTLRMMGFGGIHDHVAQGFHRYSTDQTWHVPHFEKMLYDQGQLAVVYAEAFQISGDEFFADVARDILCYVSRDLSDKDPHGELTGKNVLMMRYSLELTAARFGLDMSHLKSILSECRDQLYEARSQRPRPHLDIKMLASWNGLMISGFARSGAILGEMKYVKRAESAAAFLRSHMFDADSEKLLRSCYGGRENSVEQNTSPIMGFLEDYVFVIQALFDLYEASLNQTWLEWAVQLQQKQDELFWDQEGFAYFSSEANDSSVILRLKDEQDGAEPSANSVAAFNLLRAAYFTGHLDWIEKSSQILAAYSERLLKLPVSLTEMVRALMAYHQTLKQVIICGNPKEEDTRKLIKTVQTTYAPHKILILADGIQKGFLYRNLSFLNSLERKKGKATAYVCEKFACSLPVDSIKDLQKVLQS